MTAQGTTQELRYKSEAAHNIKIRERFRYRLILEGILIGAAVGFVVALFRLLLERADSLRTEMVERMAGSTGGVLLVLALLFVVWILVTALLRFEPDISGSGIPQVEGELRGMEDPCWWKIVIAKIAGCALAIGGGLSLGREGPSIQIGAMIGKGFARKTGALLTEERMLLTCGAGAGLAAAFGAPLAGAIFVLEELHKNFSAEVLLSTMGAATVADYIAVHFFGLTPVFDFEVQHYVPLRWYGAILVLGALLGVFGVIYNRMLGHMQDLFAKLPKASLHIGAMLAVSFALMFLYPEALGSGSGLVIRITDGEFALRTLALLLIIKFFFSTASFGTGAPGGIFLPLLVLGALAGGLYSRILSEMFGLSDELITAFVLISMAGFFAAVVRAPVTGIILLTEMTGNFFSLLPLVACVLVAGLTAELLGAEPVYEQLLERRHRDDAKASSEEAAEDGNEAGEGASEALQPEKGAAEKSARERKTILDAEVHLGSYMDGREVKDIGLPYGSLIVAVIRNGTEMIPYGRTVLRGHDQIEVLCRARDLAECESILREKCATLMEMPREAERKEEDE